MTEQKKATIKDFISIAMLSAALVFGLTHMPSSAGDQQSEQALKLASTDTCAFTLADTDVSQ